MPDTATPPVVETMTPMARELKAKADAATKEAQGSGLDGKEFDESMQSAIDKDLGRTPEKKEPEPPPAAPPAKKPEDKPQDPAPTAPAAVDDIPAELFGEKPKDPTKPAGDDPAKAEADRQKFIEEQTRGMSPKAVERFRKIELRAYDAEQKTRKLSEEREAEKMALQKQIEELKAAKPIKVDDSTEVAALKKQLVEMEEVVAKVSLAEDPRFKAAFDGKIATEVERVKKLVPAEHAEELAQLLVIPESKKRNDRITEIVDSLSGIQQAKVLAAVERVDGLAAEKATQLANWKENKVHVEAKAIREQEELKAKNSEIQQVTWAKGMDAVSSPETGLEIFRKVNGNEEWNASVETRIETVKKILTQDLKPEELVELAARSVASNEYRKLFLAQRMLVRKLNEELAALKASEPTPGDDGGGAHEPADTDDYITAAVKGSVKAGALK